MFGSRTKTKIAAAIAATCALTLTACSSSDSSSSSSASGDTYKIGINQLVQHPALDSATAGFKKAFEDAGINADFEEQNANGEQATALTIAQNFATENLDLVLAVATPAAQATAQNITDKPVLFTAVTDPVTAELVKSNDAPGGNVTGTSDVAPIKDQLELLKKLVPDTKKIGIVYASGEVNSQVQVDQVKSEAQPMGIEVATQTVSSVNEIQQAVEALGDVDAIYVPTDNMVVSGISSLVQVAEQKKIPVVAAEAGTVEGGAVATLGIDYEKLGEQTGKMAIDILKNGKNPAEMPVETASDFTYVINEDAAKAQGVTIPQDILDKAERV
ncbi:ABC transporter substrate-binding protein [Corynebacterium vitaeruminis]|uniref:ABC transporter substrate-binding protein n=1 Tax=Corynebacterium vitaeruminis TaxID=38305 RepID=UPI000553D19F|nr:ABC transporter substrate-binding protein [Corynebacterium vitaeruminis]